MTLQCDFAPSSSRQRCLSRMWRTWIPRSVFARPRLLMQVLLPSRSELMRVALQNYRYSLLSFSDCTSDDAALRVVHDPTHSPKRLSTRVWINSRCDCVAWLALAHGVRRKLANPRRNSTEFVTTSISILVRRFYYLYVRYLCASLEPRIWSTILSQTSQFIPSELSVCNINPFGLTERVLFGLHLRISSGNFHCEQIRSFLNRSWNFDIDEFMFFCSTFDSHVRPQDGYQVGGGKQIFISAIELLTYLFPRSDSKNENQELR